MGVQVSWYLENRVVYNFVWGHYTFEELRSSAAAAQHFIQIGTPLVHSVIDMRHMEQFPIKLGEIAKATPIFKEKNLGWVLLISDNRLVRWLTTATLNLSKVRFHAFSNTQEAIDFLNEMDESLPPLPKFVEPVIGEPKPSEISS